MTASEGNNQNGVNIDTNLTQSQLLIWTGQRLNLGSPLYNMALAFELLGNINVACFKDAFQVLIDNTDTLRIVINTEGGVPKQKVLSQLSSSLEVLDWSEEDHSIEKIKTWTEQRSQNNFDIAKPMFDAVLIKLTSSRFIWFFNQHHLITDGWSVGVVYKKMAQLYDLALTGNLPEAATLPPFTDYLAHELRLRQTEGRKGVTDYWNNKLKNLAEPPRLYGYTTPTGPGSERTVIPLGKIRSAKLKALTKQPDLQAWTQDLALFNIFATVLIAYLYKVSGQQSLAFGTPAHNRVKPAYKNTSGLFIELFPIGVDIDKEDRFSTLFEKVKVEAFDLLKYAQPGAASSELSRSFNVVLNYINASFSNFGEIPMKSEWVHPNAADTSHALRLQVHDFDDTGSIQLCFDLNNTLFSDNLRKQIPSHFLKLLDAFIDNRFGSFDDIQLNENPSPFPKESAENSTLQVIESFEIKAAQYPDAIALEFEGLSLTYKALNEKANRLAHLLRSKGLGKGDRGAVYMKRHPDLVVTILAILKTGAAYVPIDTNYASGRSSAILKDAAAKVLITCEAIDEDFDLAEDQGHLSLDGLTEELEQVPKTNLEPKPDAKDLAYIMYTSGSTGMPKGVMVNHGNLGFYLAWAQKKYNADERLIAALFTATGFDLTVTSLFLPLVSGGKMVIYSEPESGPDLSLFTVLEDNKVNFLKLTPSHLSMVRGKQYLESQLKTMIVGGEDFKWDVAQATHASFGSKIHVFNEYGPTEATVGCVVHLFNTTEKERPSVPIGVPITGAKVYVLDDFQNPLPDGVAGELYVSGPGLAQGYWKQEALNKESFLPNPFDAEMSMYKTGDLVRLNDQGLLEYLGRKDEQVKISGRRIELAEIEYTLGGYPEITAATVQLRTKSRTVKKQEVINCVSCGLPSSYPQAEFDETNTCGLCRSFEDYQNRVQKYFKTTSDLQNLFNQQPGKEDYDCIALLSGGKDSTYTLARLVEMGLRVLAFTLDNGYISEQAKDNIKRVVTELGVDHMYGSTPAMNQIFVDSLKTHCNVCDGCFKTIYTLSMKVALEKNIPYIVTGLSRGQFFETRLTEELFRDDKADLAKIDQIILEARKSYHRVDDAVKRLLDVSAFDDDAVFDQVKFIDFYRYTDVSLDEMLHFLDEKVSWIRPTDTGRSTNCLINQAGIHVHKKERGYSNYAFPYSWDVRLGHKTRDASLEEINEVIDEPEVERILKEIGYSEAREKDEDTKHLVAYYVSKEPLDDFELKSYLQNHLPDYMVPVQFIHLHKLPLTENGKVDRQALPLPENVRRITEVGYIAPRTDIEEALADIWSEVLNIDKIGVHDKFLELGGSSLAAIRVISRANEAFELDLPLNLAFNKPTIAAFAEYVRETIMKLLEEMDTE
ncbi:amino acid adenylation domain-containing protein [Roseivirga sp.]|uniref:amino acid adenylation domain-containing protein n=1 Tax=Roseivirga sp. TaxID=1964215 RepID=UPI003B8DBC3D